jgi:hypothetical protein
MLNKYLLSLAVPLAVLVTPGWVGAQTANVQPAQTITPSEITTPTVVTPTEILAQTNQPLGGSLQTNSLLNSSLNSLNSSSLLQSNTASGCVSSLCFTGSLTNTPGGLAGSTLGFIWSPNPQQAALQEQAKLNEIARRKLMMLEARRQVANDLATALEQKQYERARILAFQLMGAKDYRNFLIRVTGGQFPNP